VLPNTGRRRLSRRITKLLHLLHPHLRLHQTTSANSAVVVKCIRANHHQHRVQSAPSIQLTINNRQSCRTLPLYQSKRARVRMLPVRTGNRGADGRPVRSRVDRDRSRAIDNVPSPDSVWAARRRRNCVNWLNSKSACDMFECILRKKIGKTRAIITPYCRMPPGRLLHLGSVVVVDIVYCIMWLRSAYTQSNTSNN
jgi:hypothetical protein